MDLFVNKKTDDIHDRIIELERELAQRDSPKGENDARLLEKALYIQNCQLEIDIKSKLKEKKHIENVIHNLVGHLGKLLDDKDDRNKILGYIDEFVNLIAYNDDLRQKIAINQKEIDWQRHELLTIKEDKNNYLSQNKSELRTVVMHELYQRVNQTEFDAIQSLTNDVDSTDIEKLKSDLKIEYSIYHDYFSNYWHYGFHQLVNEYIQMNVSLLVKQMSAHSWGTIKTKALIFITNIKETMNACELYFNNDFEKIIVDYLKAKYLVVSKQKYEHEKEKEEREAQRDYERAIKKALKDEEKAQEQLEKKQREIEKAENATQIAKLNEQISKLKEALLNAKELRERAQSMAQQTKCGYVYVISNIGSFGKDIYKIGMTRRLDPMDRILELSNASVPFPFDVHTFIYSQDAPTLEATLHRVFENKKVNTVNYRKEYFNVTLNEIKTELDKLGIHTDFVDEPDAFQYRESQRGFSFFNEQV